jgi:hypothetical protein
MASKEAADDPAENAILTWRYPDGTVAAGHPLPREQAERLARVYGSMYPEQTYWLEPVRLDETRSYMRVRRRRNDGGPPRAVGPRK